MPLRRHGSRCVYCTANHPASGWLRRCRRSAPRGLKTYGMIVADNGSSWFITGAVDRRWNDDDLNQLKTVAGAAFEAVDTGAIHH